MMIDNERMQNYFKDIKLRTGEIENLMNKNSDNEIISQPWLLRGLKYLLIEIAEIMTNTLVHILAKDKGVSVSGYIETIIKAGELKIISLDLSKNLRPFFEFRNALVHRYWTITDSALIHLVRDNYKEFNKFIEEVEKYLKNKSNKRR